MNAKNKKILLNVSIIFFVLIVWGYLNIWRSPKFFLERNTCEPFENILSMKKYSWLSDSHERPYVFKSKNVLVFGSEHTKNPRDPQIETIDIAFK